MHHRARPLSEPMLSMATNFSESDENTTIFIDENDFENVVCIMSANLFPPQCITWSNWTILDERNICRCSLPYPDSKVHGAYLGLVGPKWAPCWPHGPCFQGIFCFYSACPHHGFSKLHMMTSSNGNIYRVTGRLFGEHRSPVHSPHTSQWRGALMSPLICTVEQKLMRLVIWVVIVPIMTSV